MLAIVSLLGLALLIFALISRERPTLFEFVAVASLIAAVAMVCGAVMVVTTVTMGLSTPCVRDDAVHLLLTCRSRLESTQTERYRLARARSRPTIRTKPLLEAITA